jgi:2,4-dienoyl-CoA reductase-like NADH-dependent reductase (Old Yellow Enzyme family)
VPTALDKEGIKEKVQAFKKAARNAIDAGFQGVEVGPVWWLCDVGM